MNTFDFDIFLSEGGRFLASLTAEMVEKGVLTSPLPCDHLCFRVETLEQYSFYKEALASQGRLLTEAPVNGRPICTFALHTPFKTEHQEVSLVELPAPKVGTSFDLGFEHAEFVIQESFQDFAPNFPDLHFQEGGNPTLNPELCLKLSNGKQAKFHHAPLDRVIEMEQASITDIIFDFDGTLIKSRENIYEINRIVFSKALDREVSLQESIDNFHSEFSKLFTAYNVTCPIKQKEAIDSWGLVAEKFTYDLFEGVLETLTWLRERSFRLHLWTARDEYSARKILKGHGLEDFFESLSFATATNSKPHSDSLQFDWKSAERNRVIVIGDSPSDIHGAKNVNAIRAAALWDPYACKNALVKAGAELFFHDVEGLRAWLK